MAALATPEARILLQVADGEPVELASMPLGVVEASGEGPIAELVFSPRRFRRDLRRLLRGLARAVR